MLPFPLLLEDRFQRLVHISQQAIQGASSGLPVPADCDRIVCRRVQSETLVGRAGGFAVVALCTHFAVEIGAEVSNDLDFVSAEIVDSGLIDTGAWVIEENAAGSLVKANTEKQDLDFENVGNIADEGVGYIGVVGVVGAEIGWRSFDGHTGN